MLSLPQRGVARSRMSASFASQGVSIELSDQALVTRLETLARRERATTLRILLLLGEVDHRRLHVALGHASLFDFATRRLGYSASAAGRRIQVARCIGKHPEIVELLRRNEANLSTIALVSRVLNDGNKRDLLARVRNRSQHDVEAIVAEYEPALRLRDRIRAVAVRVPPSSRPDEAMPATTAHSHSRSGSTTPASASSGIAPTGVSSSGSMSADIGPAATGGASVAGQMAVQRRFVVQFAASSEFMEKLAQARALLSTRRATGLEQVFEAALDALLDRHSPEQRQQRRERRQERNQTRRASQSEPGRESQPQPQPAPGAALEEPRAGTLESATLERTRAIPVALRDAVFARDGSRCTFIGPDGVRCDATHHLHVDHVIPFGRGGPSTLANLRLLCAVHNRLQAAREYGQAWPGRFRDRGNDAVQQGTDGNRRVCVAWDDVTTGPENRGSRS